MSLGAISSATKSAVAESDAAIAPDAASHLSAAKMQPHRLRQCRCDWRALE